MVNIANQTIQNYLTSLDETTKKEVFHILASKSDDLEKEYTNLKDSTISKLNSLYEEQSESEMKTRISETIEKIQLEDFDQVNYIRLKQLEESLSQEN
jgi:ribosomal protein S20